MKVDEPELIAKFLSLKKEERDPRMSQLRNQRNNRPRREARRTVDFTPSNPGGGPQGGSFGQMGARHTTPFNPHDSAAKANDNGSNAKN